MNKAAQIIAVVSCCMASCNNDEPVEKTTAHQKIDFKIEGTIERIDSTYKDGLHRVSTFIDEKTNERVAYVKFHDNGHPYTDMRFKGDRKNGVSWSYYENGNPWSMNIYRNDTLHGEYKTFHENGQVFYQGNYTDGKQDGEWFTFYPNGKMDTRGFYALGEKTGIWTTYNKEGSLMRETDYSKK